MTEAITSFKREYAFLSNFYGETVVYQRVAYASAEHAYQAAKTLDQDEHDAVVRAATPNLAKKLGRNLTLRDDWEEIKLREMGKIVRAKFANRKLAVMLLETGDAELVEGNWWNDTFWGVCRGRGENHLGKILMAVREELRRG